MTAATSPTLVKDLQKQVKFLTDDLRTRSDDPTDAWGQELKTEYRTATERGRTGLSWSEWRDGEVDLAAVAWGLATVFIRFCEDNDLIDGPWITGEGPRHGQAADNETAFYQAEPSRNARDWLRAGFEALAGLPAGRSLLDPHNLVWRAPISADAAQQLLAFWRMQTDNGSLVHDFVDADLDTRFLGDLYQDLSDHAKKKYALLQTPIFVEEFILDHTLTPAIAEFGIDGLKLIDPTCGSGHFLLGAFDRLLNEWHRTAPAMDARTRVQKALDSIYGVDINPFAVAIARFRITVAAMRASGIQHLAQAPRFSYHLAVGDSLIRHGVQHSLLDQATEFEYANEDVSAHPGILERGRYHVVVGNPPYITVKDQALNERYRQDYATCSGKYALTVPFMELFFALSVHQPTDGVAGYVGQITGNSFMKREFGKKLIENFLSGNNPANRVDLTHVIDTAGAYIPGHGTPTVILIGRHRKPVSDRLRAVLGVNGEPGQPSDAAEGLVWREIVDHVDGGEFNGEFVTVTDLERAALASHPWSLSGGGAGELMDALRSCQQSTPTERSLRMGFFGVMGADEAFMRTFDWVKRHGDATNWRPLVVGDQVRDFTATAEEPAFFPYNAAHVLKTLDLASGDARALWPLRTELGNRATFSKRTYFAEGRPWFEWHQLPKDDGAHPWALVIAETGTHNHVVLDVGGHVFKQSAPVIKLPATATEDDFFDLLGGLNSSIACFWLRQTSQRKAGALQGGGISTDPWSWIQQFNVTRWAAIPLCSRLPRERARRLDALARECLATSPAEVLRAGHVSEASLADAEHRWESLRAQMVFEQEELDWDSYEAYGLIDERLTFGGTSIDALELGARPFEILLARRMMEGIEATRWFERHGSTPITAVPNRWPEDYARLAERRLEAIQLSPQLALLERPEHKRRWSSVSWATMRSEALRELVLSRLEDGALWSDSSGPQTMSIAQLADRVRGDSDLLEAVRLLRGAVDIDLTRELSSLLGDECVPYLAALRYSPTGLRKRTEWETVWDLQRREDAGERVSIPVPPKYTSADFLKPASWKARGKLDVPKERFISYPMASRDGDNSMVVGWAGWDHLEQARALARLVMDRTASEGWDAVRLLPLLAGLVELEPWLQQWHNDPDLTFGGSPAAFMSGFIDDQLAGMSKTRIDCKAWRP